MYYLDQLDYYKGAQMTIPEFLLMKGQGPAAAPMMRPS